MGISGYVENHYLKEGPAPFLVQSPLTSDSPMKDESGVLRLPITMFVADLSKLQVLCLAGSLQGFIWGQNQLKLEPILVLDLDSHFMQVVEVLRPASLPSPPQNYSLKSLE